MRWAFLYTKKEIRKHSSWYGGGRSDNMVMFNSLTKIFTTQRTCYGLLMSRTLLLV